MHFLRRANGLCWKILKADFFISWIYPRTQCLNISVVSITFRNSVTSKSLAEPPKCLIAYMVRCPFYKDGLCWKSESFEFGSLTKMVRWWDKVFLSRRPQPVVQVKIYWSQLHSHPGTKSAKNETSKRGQICCNSKWRNINCLRIFTL